MAPMVPRAVRGRVAWPAVTVAAVSPAATAGTVWSAVIGATAPPEAMVAVARPRGTVNLAEWRWTVRSVPEKEPRQTGPRQYRVRSWIVRPRADAGSMGEGAWLDLAVH